MRIMVPEAPGPLIVSGTLWRRWQRENPSGSFSEFVLYLDDYYGKIKVVCAQVTAEELLQQHLRRYQKRETSVSCGNPTLLIAPKPEPIELSSDSSTDGSSNRSCGACDPSNTAEGRRSIEA